MAYGVTKISLQTTLRHDSTKILKGFLYPQSRTNYIGIFSLKKLKIPYYTFTKCLIFLPILMLGENPLDKGTLQY